MFQIKKELPLVEITGGLYNPSTDNPLEFPDIECDADFPEAMPAIAWRIQ